MQKGFLAEKEATALVKYILKRLLYMVLTLWVITTLTFFLMKMLPGTPFDAERLALMSESQRNALMASYGLDKPVVQQYFIYLGNILTGNFGTSFTYVNQRVADVVVKRLAPSVLVGVQACVLGITTGLIFGIMAAWYHNTIADYITMVLAVLGVSVPNFVVAALMQYYMGYKWGVLPVAFWSDWSCSIMPTLALSFTALAQVARFMRTEMLEVLGQDYIITARAKGLSSGKVLTRHAIRNSLIPVVTVVGPIVVNLLTGSLAVESIFCVPGIGSLFVDSIKANDYSVIMAITIFYSAFYMIVVLLMDVTYQLIDPRIRLSAGSGE